MSRAGLLLAALSGALLALSLPPHPVALLAPLWAAPLALALARLPAGGAGGPHAFLAGAVCGGVEAVLLLHWAPGAATPLLGPIGAWGAAGALWGSRAAMAGLATWAAHRVAARSAFALAPALALGWILLGWIPTLLPGIGFPWLGPEAALVDRPELLGLVRWGGGGAVAGLLVLMGASLGAMIAEPDRRHLLACALALVLLGAGAVRAPVASTATGTEAAGEAGEVLRVALVALEVGPESLVDREARRRLPGELGHALEELLEPGEVDLLIWPESPAGPTGAAGPGSSPEALAARALALTLETPVYFGAVEPGAEGGSLRNRFLRVDGEGQGSGVMHEKRRLVPGVEWRPGRGGVGPGTAREPFELRGGVPAGALICFEALFAGEGARLRRKGARLLILPANEGWLRRGPLEGVGAARAQFEAVAVLRAVELAVPVLRSSVGGEAGGFGPDGRRLEWESRRTSGRTAVLVGSVRAGADEATPFARGGGLALHLSALLLLIVFFGRALRGRRAGTPGGQLG